MRGKIFLVWTPESVQDYLGHHPNLEGALSFVSAVDGNSGDDGGQTVTDPAVVFVQTYETLPWASPVTAAEITQFNNRVCSDIAHASYLRHETCSTIPFQLGSVCIKILLSSSKKRRSVLS